MKSEMSRKEFLRLMFLGIAAGAGGSLLASCSKEEETAQTSTPPSGDAPKTASKPAAADPCSDVSGLSELDLKMRNETLQYVAVSPEPDKICDNCKFWVPPEAGQTCGGCTLIKGPINPKGYCTSWFTSET